MPRTTTDDCTERCPNHFTLAHHAATRAHEIMRRGDARVPEGEDKSIVVALREIARGVSEPPPLAAELGADAANADNADEDSGLFGDSVKAADADSDSESDESETAADSSAGGGGMQESASGGE